MQTAALFDLDGVLVNTEEQYTQFWEAVGRTDFPEDLHFAISIKGQTLVQIFDKYYKGDTDRQKQLTEELADFEKRMDFPFIAGAADFVAALREAGIFTAVVTSSNQEKMTCLYHKSPGFVERFDHIFTAEDAGRSKPAPDCYVNAARFFGLDARDCFVFEDSMSGLQAGRDSGATVIALTTTNGEESVRPFCQHFMKDFTEFSVGQMLDLKK